MSPPKGGIVPTEHAFPDTQVHFKWDVGNEPALVIQSGDSVTLETRDVSDNQITPSSTAADIGTIDWDRVYPLAGPIGVDGAEPGDTLAVEILEMRVQDWGWTAIIPGLGLLPDEFPSAYMRVFDLTDGEHAFLREDVAIPIEPFFGTMGVCPAGAKEQAVMPPGTFGGNMDTRQLVQGATLYLPVEVEGALFTCGDAHAAQGDGEVCVTGIETPIGASFASRSRRAGDPGAAVPDARAADATREPGRVVRHDRRRARSLRGRAGRRARHGRAHLGDLRPLAPKTRTCSRASAST